LIRFAAVLRFVLSQVSEARPGAPIFVAVMLSEMQILRFAYPTVDESTAGPQACSAQGDTGWVGGSCFPTHVAKCAPWMGHPFSCQSTYSDRGILKIYQYPLNNR
jgi:hypothetical protein